MKILGLLRDATGALHARIEGLPFCKSLLAGEVDRGQYVELLTQLYHLHDQYETEIAASNLSWPVLPSRAAAIARDLKAFDVEIGEVPSVVHEWNKTIQSFNHPAAWAGVGYVLEGSRMGSRVLVKSISRGLNLPLTLGVGLDYHLGAGNNPNEIWQQVIAALVTADDAAVGRNAMIKAAVATFESMYLLHEQAILDKA
jgi:heme oxygenase